MTSETKSFTPPVRRGFFTILSGMVIHPWQTLATIRDQSSRGWLILALLATIAVMLPTIVSAPITARITREAMQQQLENMPPGQPQLDPGDREQMMQMATNPVLTVVLPSVMSAAVLWVGWLIWSGALHLLSTMAGGAGHFGAMWRGVVWSWIPLFLRSIVQSLFILVTGEVITNPGLSGLITREQSVSELLAEPPGAGYLALHTFLAQIDLFTIWNLILLVLTVAVVARLSKRKAAGITLAIWAIFMLFRIALAALPGFFLSGGM